MKLLSLAIVFTFFGMVLSERKGKRKIHIGLTAIMIGILVIMTYLASNAGYTIESIFPGIAATFAVIYIFLYIIDKK